MGIGFGSWSDCNWWENGTSREVGMNSGSSKKEAKEVKVQEKCDEENICDELWVINQENNHDSSNLVH